MRSDASAVAAAHARQSATYARVLLAVDVDPNTMLEMWWPRSTEFALRGSVRQLARLTVRHDRLGSPVFAQFVEPRKEPS